MEAATPRGVFDLSFAEEEFHRLLGVAGEELDERNAERTPDLRGTQPRWSHRHTHQNRRSKSTVVLELVSISKCQGTSR